MAKKKTWVFSKERRKNIIKARIIKAKIFEIGKAIYYRQHPKKK